MDFHEDQLHDHHHGNEYNLNNKILLTTIVSLSSVSVIVFLLYFYGRCLLWCQARRRAAIPLLTIAVVHSGQLKTGLDPSVIASLPIFVYKQTDRFDETATVDCAVCLSTLKGEDMARLLPNCNHMFHAQCIDTWLSSNSTCPICRREAEPQAQPKSVESGAGVLPASTPQISSHSTCSICCTVAEPQAQPDSVESGAGVPASVPQLNLMATSSETTPDAEPQSSKFRRILIRDRSERRIQPGEKVDTVEI